MQRTIALSLALVGLNLLACTSEDTPLVDAGLVADAGTTVDAGLLDAGETPTDAGQTAADAGVVEMPPVALMSGQELVTLVELIDSNSNQVVDVRSANDFAAGHVPGAVNLPTNGLRTTVDGVPSQVVPRAIAEGIFESAGIYPDRRLIVVGASNDTTTARALWTLAYYAVENVVLLDGGYPAYIAAGGSETTDDIASPTTWTDAPTAEGLRTDKAWLLDHYQDADVAIFDVRSAGEYAGGHIPGAINRTWTDNLGGGGLFDDSETIRANHGNPTATTLIVYCQSGARASVTWSLLKAVGYEDVRLYDGSWNEWGADPNTPKETGN